MKLSLQQKVLLLVSIPLIFEVGFFAFLLSLQNQLEDEATRINRSRLIGDAVARVTTRLVVLEDTFQHFDTPISGLAKARQAQAEIAQEFEGILKLTEPDPETHAVVEKCIQEMKATEADFEELRERLKTIEPQELRETSRNFRARFNTHFRKIVDLGLWQLAERSAREINTDRSSALRKQTVLLLKCALLLSCLIGLLSALVYSNYLIVRLQKLAANAKRLGQGQPLVPLKGGDDEIVSVDKVLHRAARDIRRLEETREEMIGMISHDIRSPLATIKCANDLLAADFEASSDDDARLKFRSINENCDRILAITRDLLDIQRLEAGSMLIEKARTDLGECVINALRATEGLCTSRGVKVEQHLERAEAMVDAVRIEQVITNLLTNAVKFSPRNGTVIIRLKTEDRWVHFSVEDQGKGIPPHLRKAIFNRFSQVEADDARTKGGSGLGLAISKALVEAHGGKIGNEGIEPKGSRFFFSIPCEAN